MVLEPSVGCSIVVGRESRAARQRERTDRCRYYRVCISSSSSNSWVVGRRSGCWQQHAGYGHGVLDDQYYPQERLGGLHGHGWLRTVSPGLCKPSPRARSRCFWSLEQLARSSGLAFTVFPGAGRSAALCRRSHV